MPEWDAIFLPSVPLLDLFLRGTLIFLALTGLTRIVGQRESGGLGITDLMVVVLVAEAANPGLAGDAKSVTDSLLQIAVILGWSVALDAVAYRWPSIGRILKARPKPLIEDGRLNRQVMRREFLADGEVMSQLRLQGIEDPGRVRRAYIEPNGQVSILTREDPEPTGAPEPPV
jgi:uncharacterized membrane protein YcaP (DUF421 family)